MPYTPTPRYFMYPARNYRAYCWNYTPACNRVACCSVRTHAAITKRGGTVDATARTMISILGAAFCQLWDLLSLITIIAPPVSCGQDIGLRLLSLRLRI